MFFLGISHPKTKVYLGKQEEAFSRVAIVYCYW